MGFLTNRERWLIAGVVALFVLGGAVRYYRSEADLARPSSPEVTEEGGLADG